MSNCRGLPGTQKRVDLPVVAVNRFSRDPFPHLPSLLFNPVKPNILQLLPNPPLTIPYLN